MIISLALFNLIFFRYCTGVSEVTSFNKEITGLDDEKINENFNVQARRRLEEYLVLLAVANTEKITLTDKDLEDYYANVAAQYGMEVEKVKEVFSKNVDRIRQNLIQDKIVRFLIDSNIAVKEENK